MHLINRNFSFAKKSFKLAFRKKPKLDHDDAAAAGHDGDSTKSLDQTKSVEQGTTDDGQGEREQLKESSVVDRRSQDEEDDETRKKHDEALKETKEFDDDAGDEKKSCGELGVMTTTTAAAMKRNNGHLAASGSGPGSARARSSASCLPATVASMTTTSNAVLPPSSARRRWMLLSSKVVSKVRSEAMQSQSQQHSFDSDYDNDYYLYGSDGFKSFGFFALSAFGERSAEGTSTWYRLISSTKPDINLDLHFLDAFKMTSIKDLVGFDNTGNVRLWPSEECLAEYLLQNEAICKGKRVLELGAGMTGLAGLVAGWMGASLVYLTDGNEKSVQNLKLIIEHNSLGFMCKSALLEWSGERLEVDEKFDVILCADCIFFTNTHQALLGCIHAHLKEESAIARGTHDSARGGIAYIMAPSRRGTAQQFLCQIYQERNRWKNVQVVFEFQRAIQRRIKLFENELFYNADIHRPILFILEK